MIPLPGALRNKENKFKIKSRNMKWTSKNYPLEMEELEPRVKEKAIEIANRLKQEGEVKELSIVDQAIKQAKEWFLEMEG